MFIKNKALLIIVSFSLFSLIALTILLISKNLNIYTIYFIIIYIFSVNIIAIFLIFSIKYFSNYISNIEKKATTNFSTFYSSFLTNDLTRSIFKLERRILLYKKEINEERKKYFETIDSIPLPILLIDKNKIILKSNKSFSTNFLKNYTGNNFHELFRSPNTITSVNKAIKGESCKVELEFFNTISSRNYSFIVYFQPMSRRLNVISYVTAIFIDQTSLKKIINARTDFIANASHEIKTPLTTIIGVVETLKNIKSSDTNSKNKFLDMLSNHTYKMNALINNLLSLSKSEMNETSYPKNTINISNVLYENIKWFRAGNFFKSKSIKVKIAKDIKTYGSKEDLTQANKNIIENMIKYGGNKLSIKLKIKVGKNNDKKISIMFIDNGKGISKIDLDRVTERFYRAKGNSIEGSGLGLSIAKHKVYRHKGTLEIKSKINLGTIVIINLPVIKD